MKYILQNMCMIYNKEKKEVLVLNKKKKEGWEGLMFPGGHVEKFESFQDSTIREVKEETGLKISNLKFCGFVQWQFKEKEEILVGFLYYTEDYTGNLIPETREGENFWMNLDEFIRLENKAVHMDELLRVFLEQNTNEFLAVHKKEHEYKSKFIYSETFKII